MTHAREIRPKPGKSHNVANVVNLPYLSRERGEIISDRHIIHRSLSEGTMIRHRNLFAGNARVRMRKFCLARRDPTQHRGEEGEVQRRLEGNRRISAAAIFPRRAKLGESKCRPSREGPFPFDRHRSNLSLSPPLFLSFSNIVALPM